MAYADYKQYCSLYEDIDKKTFDRLQWDAGQLIDSATTGVDGIKKLQIFPPTAGSNDAEAVKRCTCRLINTMLQVQQAEQRMAQVSTSAGTHGGVISSISAGNESISYANAVQTPTEKAALDPVARKTLYSNIIRQGLSGIRDGNGINVLFMGQYPTGRWG